MNSKYGWYDCWYCLCEVCVRIHCPNTYRRFTHDFCISMILRERCPVIKCDFFRHKEKHKVYKIVRRHRRRDSIIERLDNIEKGIAGIDKKLLP